MARELSKKIWILWLQGWGEAPEVAISSRDSWILRNPEWDVYCLSKENISDFLSFEVTSEIFNQTKEHAAQSDRIRIELLAKYGGVWVDATTICIKPLDEWLSPNVKEGFFAFSKPGGERPLSSWFMAAESGNYIINQWRDMTRKIWRTSPPSTYFWFHDLFKEALERDPEFNRIWECVPEISAQHSLHLNPGNAKELQDAPNQKRIRAFEDMIAPVAKLTHKAGNPKPGSLFKEILKITSPKRNYFRS